MRVMRVIRLLWPDRSPLRRTTDMAEVVILAALVISFLVAAPLAVIAAGHVAYGEGARRARAERVAWHRVRAKLLDQAVALGYGGAPEAPAVWTAPDGARRGGLLSAPPGARAGSTVRVWTDASGRLTGPPLTPAQVRDEAVVFAALAPIGLGIVLLGAGMLARCLLARRRLSDWDAEWRVAGPQWSRQR